MSNHHQHHHSHNQHGDCNNHECNHVSVDSVTQTLDELSFERGIWGCILNSDYKKVEQILEKNSSMSNKIDHTGFYPLHYAVRSDNNIDMVQLLLNHGADINVQTDGGATPLHRSCYCNALKVTKLLLQNGVTKVNLVDCDGRTPLHKAYSQGNKEIAQLLISFGANQNILDKNQQTPIQLLKQ